MRRKIKYSLHLCFIALGLCFFVGCGKKELTLENVDSSVIDSTDQVKETETTEDLETTSVFIEGQEESLYPVYVCGAVMNPGVYYLDAGDIKDNAILAAGGFTENAETTYVNLAENISYGEQIYVPTKQELEDAIQQSDYKPWLVGNSEQANLGQSNSVQDDSSLNNSEKVNLNIATKSELMTLPGIGENKANAIIQYRETQGYFQTPEDVMKVEGIKEGVYDKIKDFVVVE